MTSIEFKPTKKHGNADMMSRLLCVDENGIEEKDMIYSLQISTLPVTAGQMKKETENDVILTEVKHCLHSGNWPQNNELLRPYYRRCDEFHIEDGVIMLGLRVVIPEVVRNRVLKERLRNHLGIVKMKALSINQNARVVLIQK